MASGFEGEFTRDTIFSSAPNYPYGKDDPDQLEFDKAVDDALRNTLRNIK